MTLPSVRFGALSLTYRPYVSGARLELFAKGQSPYKGEDSAVYLNDRQIGNSIGVLKLSRRLAGGDIPSQKELTKLVQDLGNVANNEGQPNAELRTAKADPEKPFYPQGETRYLSGLEWFKKLQQHPRGYNPFLTALEQGEYQADIPGGDKLNGVNSVSYNTIKEPPKLESPLARRTYAESLLPDFRRLKPEQA